MSQINKPTDYFNTALWSGNSSTQSVTGVGFQPDFTWIKRRTVTAEGHVLFDSIRGATNFLVSNRDDAEATLATTLTSFDSDGFSLGGNDRTNGSGDYVGWNWLGANASSSNNDGSITSSVSANTTSGFSVVKWTGTGASLSNVTIGHGLGAVPKVVLFKQLDTGNWVVYHQAIGKDNYLVLNSTNASASATGLCNPTSTNIVLETSYGGTNSTGGMIAYCFAEKKGFSKFGSYTGNGSTDGTFVYTGFKPAFFLIKNINDGTDDWHIMDNKRNGYNPQNNILQPNLTSAEGSSTRVDFLSNGIKINSSSAFINGSGETIIYMAFAESPLVGTNNIPATAR